MNAASTSVRTGDGVSLHVHRWAPRDEPHALLLIAHGFAEHSGRYAALGAELAGHGFLVVAPDHRGHGRSSGKRRSIRRFADYADDLRRVLDDCAAETAHLQTILLGHSMGGLVALDFAVRALAPLRALVLSAPAACPGRVSRLMVASGRIVSRVAPDAGVLRLPLSSISKDSAVVDAYMNDPLVSAGPMRARMGAEMLDTMAAVDAALPSLHVPMLVMQGSEDRLVDPGCGPHVFERAGSPDKTLRIYPGLWHEIFNEPERDRVVGDLVVWLDAHSGAQSPAG